jgi:transposase
MIWTPSTLTRKQMAQRRRQGGRWLTRTSLSQAEIARRLGVSRTAVSTWAQQIEHGGVRALCPRRSSGRPRKLTRAQERDLKRQLRRGALAAGFQTERWTLPRIQKLIRREYGVQYHVNYLPRLLARLGFSLQQPLPRAVERKATLIRAWLSQDWPRIKKKARRNDLTIVFFDEFGFSFREATSRTWAPRGRRPLLRRVTSERRAISTAVGLTLTGKIYKRHFKGSMHSEQVIETLHHLLRQSPEGFVLIWDRARIHTSAKTQNFLTEHPEIRIEWLPPYAPELNAEEYCHGQIKRRLKNATPADDAQLCMLLDTGFAWLRRRPDLILHCFHAAGLSVNQLW